MNNLIVNSERKFQIWKYTVGHHQLLLRSPKSPESPTRIDILFKGVALVHLRTSLVGISIAEISKAQAEDLVGELSALKDIKVFTAKSTGFVGYVVALSAACHEDEGEYNDPSFFSENNII